MPPVRPITGIRGTALQSAKCKMQSPKWGRHAILAAVVHFATSALGRHSGRLAALPARQLGVGNDALDTPIHRNKDAERHDSRNLPGDHISNVEALVNVPPRIGKYLPQPEAHAASLQVHL